MTRKRLTTVVILSLWLGSPTSALAQEHRVAEVDGPPGANATLNFRVPLGDATRRSRPTFGLTLGFGRTLGARTDGVPLVRQMPLADLRFSTAGLANARLASFDLAHLDRDRRLNFDGNDALLWGVAGTAAAVALCAILGCFDGDDDETEADSGPSTPNPG